MRDLGELLITNYYILGELLITNYRRRADGRECSLRRLLPLGELGGHLQQTRGVRPARVRPCLLVPIEQ